MQFLVGALLLASLAARGDENLLSNAGFESGGKRDVALWSSIAPPNERAEFEHADEGAHSGKRCGRLTTRVGAGYSSFTQVIEDPPEEATFVRLVGWIKAEELGAGGAASLFLLMYDPRDDAKSSSHPSQSVTSVGEWTRVEVAAAVPAGAKKWIVRCGVSGVARACFDDVELTWSKQKPGEVALAKLVVGHGDYFVATRNATKAAWIRASIPFPFEGQTPLAVRVRAKPEGTVAHLGVVAQRENRPLEIVLAPTVAGARVELSIDTLVLVRDRPLSDGAGVELARKGRLPEDVAPHLKRAPGVDADDGVIKSAAKKLAREDFAALMRDATRFLEQRLEYSGGASQGASECVESGKAVCTGYANVAAALLIAADVPTRILACTQTSGRLQEHYIVESWTAKLGWSRMESTMARFPWGDANNLILRIVYPDSNRSPADVPLYVELAGGVDGGFRGDPETGCWQGADELRSLTLELSELTPVEDVARAAFERLLSAPAAGDRVRFAPPSSSVEDGSATRALLEEIERWLAE